MHVFNDSSSRTCSMCRAERPREARESSGRNVRADERARAKSDLPPDVIIASVENFLKGRDWKVALDAFVRQNCAAFASIEGESDHGQYDIFLRFKSMASGLLDGTLREIGTDADEFIDACQLRLSEPDAGPRDAAMKSMLKQLFTYENFIIFRKMMYDKNKALEDEEMFEREFQEQSLQYRQQQELASQLSSSPASSERFPSPTRSPPRGQRSEFSSGPWACPMCTFQNDSGRPRSVCKHDRRLRT